MTAIIQVATMMANLFSRCCITLMVVLTVAFSYNAEAQSRFEKTDSSVTVFLPGGSVRLQICSDRIIRIIHSRTPATMPETSLSVNASWTRVPFDIFRKEGTIEIHTEKLTVMVDEQSGAVSIKYPDGKQIYTECHEQPVSFTPAVVLGEATRHAQLNFRLSVQEGIYGMGQFQNGVMNYRGHDLTLVQENTQIAIPFLLSTKKYGLMFDNYSKIRFHDGKDSTFAWFEVADVIDYYFISGDDMSGVIRGYRIATGRAPMLPRWAYGYWQSKERYKTQDEVLNIAHEFRSRHIPVDNIVQDWQYWGDDNAYWNAMRFDSTRYPDPRGMISELHNKYNTHLIVSLWPVIGQKTALFNVMESKGLLFKPYHWTDGHTYDAYNPEARRLYWDAVNRGLFQAGVDGYWLDATEPEILVAPTERSTKEARRNALGTMARYLNPYSLLTTGAVYDGQRSVTGDKRVCILTRSAFLGQQRNSAAAWSGDIVADWNVLRNQISAGLNYCMAGLPYWSNDIGGFHIRRYGGFPGGSNNPGYRELYVRWFQFGAFNPVFRSHGTDSPREPWQFGEPGSWAYDALIKYDHLRYRMMPYIYSLAWQVTQNGYTIMRGLPMDFPADATVYAINDQFMFGPSLMVNPVTQHMYYGDSYINELIPPELLRTPEGQRGGFRAQYFNGTGLDTLMADSLQTELLFDMYLGRDLPPIVNWERNSIRWSGSFRTRGAGSYEFWLTADDAVRFYLDDKLLVDAWNNSGTDTTFRITVPLKAGRWYPFRVEYARKADATKLRLAWKTPEMATGRFDPSKGNGTRRVYLPRVQGGWFDFWTGERVKGGSWIKRLVPIDIMPLYAKAGSVIPMGPHEEYASEKTGGPIELRVYTGADASFDLYDDEGDSYNYEQGKYAIIPIRWNEKDGTLTIGKRSGSFPGMPESLVFNIVWVKKDHGSGLEPVTKPDAAITYTGEPLVIKKD